MKAVMMKTANMSALKEANLRQSNLFSQKMKAWIPVKLQNRYSFWQSKYSKS